MNVPADKRSSALYRAAFRNARISDEYLAARLNELKWAAIANALKDQEREEQRQLREQMREEEKARKEYERAIKEAAKEEDTIKKAMEKVQLQVAAASDAQKVEYEAKLPDLTGVARTTLQDGEPLTAGKSYPGALVQLEEVLLEKGVGHTRPDVIAQMRESSPWEAGPILIEVTVTNAITDERMQRIRQNNLPTLEIDIRQLGGKVSRSEYTRLVVDEVAGKRWLHHPCEALLRQQASLTLSQQAAQRNREIDQRREQETEPAKFQKIPESLQRIIPPQSERTTTGSYPRKPRTHHWKHGPISMANSVQWRNCGCTQWEDVLRYAQECRAEHQTVAIALKMCSERYGYSISFVPRAITLPFWNRYACSAMRNGYAFAYSTRPTPARSLSTRPRARSSSSASPWSCSCSSPAA